MSATAIVRDLRTRRRENALEGLRSEIERSRRMFSDACDAFVAAIESYEHATAADPYMREQRADEVDDRLLTAAEASRDIFGGSVSAKALREGARRGSFPSRHVPSVEGSRPRIMFSRRELLEMTRAATVRR